MRRNLPSIADSVNKNSHSIFFIEREGKEFSRIFTQLKNSERILRPNRLLIVLATMVHPSS